VLPLFDVSFVSRLTSDHAMRWRVKFHYLLASFAYLCLVNLSAMQPCRSTEIKTDRFGIAPISLNAGYSQILSLRGGAYLDFSNSYCERSAIFLLLEPGVTATKGVVAYGLDGYYFGVHAGIGYLYNYLSLSENNQKQYGGGEMGIRGFNIQVIAGLYHSGLFSSESQWLVNFQIGFFLYPGSPKLR